MSLSNDVDNKLQKVGGKVQSTIGDAVGSPANSVEGRVRSAAGAAGEWVGEAQETVEDAAQTMRAKAGRAVDATGETLSDARDSATRAVQDYPLSALVIAGVIGFALGYAMRPEAPPRSRSFF